MASKVHEIAFQIAGKLASGFSGTFKTAAKTVGTFGDKLNSLNKQAAQLDGVMKMRREVGETKRSFVETQAKATELGRSFANAKQNTAKLKTEFLQSQAQTDKLRASMQAAKTPSAELARAFEQSRLKTDILSLSLKTAEEETKKLRAAMQAAKTPSAELARAFEQSRLKTDILSRSLKTAEAETQRLGERFNRERAAARGAEQSLIAKKAALQNAERAAGTNGAKLETLIKRQNELAASAEKARVAQQKLSNAQGAMKANNATLSATAPYATATGAGVMAGIGSAVATGAAYEKEMSRVKAISKATEEEMAKLGKQARELGASTVWSASEVAQGMQFLSMAGFKTNDVLATMPGMLALASAGNLDLARAADISSNILTGFGMEAKDMSRVSDVLTNAFTNSNTSLEQLGQSMKYAAPIAKTFGASIEDVAAMTGKLGDAGIQGEMAGTALRGVMTRLGAPSAKAAKALEELGVKTTDASGKMRSFPAILADLDKATKGMSESMRAEYAKNIFETEAMGSALILMEQAGSGSLQKFSKSLTEAGAAERVAKEQTDNLSGDFKALQSALEETALTIYDTIAPSLREITQWATQATAQVAKFANENKGLVKVITFAAAGFGILATAALPLMAAIKTLQFLYAALKAPFLAINLLLKLQKAGYFQTTAAMVANKVAVVAHKAAMIAQKAAMVAVRVAMLAWKGVVVICTAAQWALNAALSANPIGLVIVAIAALVAAGVLLWQNWDTVKAKATELWASFSEKFPAIAEVFTSAFERIKSIANDVKTVFANIIDFVKNVFAGEWSAAWENVKNAFGAAFSALTGLVKLPFNGVISTVNAAIQSINDAVGKVSVPDWVPIWGGKSFTFNIPEIPQLAAGGIATKPTMAMIGEGGESEAVLPLSKLKSMLGGGAGGANVSVNFAPVINVSGGSGDAYNAVKRGLEEGQKSLKRELEKLLSNQRRLSYT